MSRHNAGSRAGRKRRIMRAFKVNEISVVDRPAQQGAVAVIMKRKGAPGYDPKNPDRRKRGRAPQTENEQIEKGSALTTEEEGHTHLLILVGPPDGVELNSGTTSWDDEHAHPWIKTEGGEIVIGLSSRRPGGEPHTHDVAAVSKDADEATNRGDDDMTVTKKPAEAPSVEDLQKQIERGALIALLSDVEKVHFVSLEGPAQDEFLAKSVSERTKDLAAEATKQAAPSDEDDPVVHKTASGVEIRKSAGPVALALAISNDELTKRMGKLEAERADETYRKRAETELGHLPGDVATRVAILKSVEAIEDEGQRKSALETLKAQDAGLASAFETAGVGGSPVPGSPTDTLDKMAAEYQKAHTDVTPEQAMAKVLETPAGADLYAKSIN